MQRCCGALSQWQELSRSWTELLRNRQTGPPALHPWPAALMSKLDRHFLKHMVYASFSLSDTVRQSGRHASTTTIMFARPSGECRLCRCNRIPYVSSSVPPAPPPSRCTRLTANRMLPSPATHLKCNVRYHCEEGINWRR